MPGKRHSYVGIGFAFVSVILRLEFRTVPTLSVRTVSKSKSENRNNKNKFNRHTTVAKSIDTRLSHRLQGYGYGVHEENHQPVTSH